MDFNNRSMWQPWHLYEDPDDGGDDEPADPQQRFMLMLASVGVTLLAGIMSGLTLGLMSLDTTQLEVLIRSGTPSESKNAKRILPVVKNTHHLLVTLLLTNAVAMTTLPLFLDRLVDPATALILSVTAVLFFGEIIPQAACVRYGLAIGAKFARLVWLLMWLTSPISWSVGKLLDAVLGTSHNSLFRRQQLKALVDVHGEATGLGGKLSLDEIKVITGALDLTSKIAYRSMTPMSNVVSLSCEDRLDTLTLSRILDSGHSRIPVHRAGHPSDLVGLLLVKELLQYKGCKEVPVSMLKLRSLPRLSADTPMYDMLKLFQTGRSHMAVLTQPYDDDSSDSKAKGRGVTDPGVAAAAAAAAAAPAAAALAETDSRAAEEAIRLNMVEAIATAANDNDEDERLAVSSSGLLSEFASDATPHGARQHSGVTGRTASRMAATSNNGDVARQPSYQRDVLEGADVGAFSEQGKQEEGQQNQGEGSSHQPEVSQDIEAGFGQHQHLDGTQEPPASPTGEATEPGADLADGGFPGAADSASAAAALLNSMREFKVEYEEELSEHESDMSTRSAAEDEGQAGGSGYAKHKRPSKLRVPRLSAPGEPIGIITIEDVIEELIRAEIVDETDRFVDNEHRVRVEQALLAATLPDRLRQVAGLHAADLLKPGAIQQVIHRRTASSTLGVHTAHSSLTAPLLANQTHDLIAG